MLAERLHKILQGNRDLQLFLESRMEDKTFVGQHKRKHEFPVVTQI